MKPLIKAIQGVVLPEKRLNKKQKARRSNNCFPEKKNLVNENGFITLFAD